MPKELMKAEPVKTDGNTGEIIEIHPTTEEIVEKVKHYLESQEKKIFFNQKRYPQYADWQYIGNFYGITVKTFDPHFVEIAGRKGFTAKAMLLRDQAEIGRAEAFCMDDEPNWRNKPLFQLASMAQTRAATKAYSNLFRHIVGLAGIETTPAEEMSDEALPPKRPPLESEHIADLGRQIIGPTEEEIAQVEEIMSDQTAARAEPDELQHIKDQIPFPEPKPGVQPISEKQRKLIWVLCRKAKIPEADLKKFIIENWDVDSTGLLPWQAMKPLLQWINSYAPSK